MVVVIIGGPMYEVEKTQVSGVGGTRKLFRDMYAQLYDEKNGKLSEVIRDVLNDEFDKLVNFDEFIEKNTKWYLPIGIREMGCWVWQSKVKKFECIVYTKPKLYNYIVSSDPHDLISSAKHYVENASSYKRSFVKLNEKLLKYLEDFDYYYYLATEEEFSRYVDYVVKRVGEDIKMEYLNIVNSEPNDEEIEMARNDLIEISKWFLHDNHLEKRKSTDNFRKYITKIKYSKKLFGKFLTKMILKSGEYRS